MNPKELPGLFSITLRIVIIMAAVEFGVMVILAFGDAELALFHATVDVLLLTAVASPLIYYFAIRPFVIAYRGLVEQARQTAYMDPLTGLLNRRQLETYVERAHASAKRHGQFAALIYFDLDGFKPINDRYGHQAGDKLLVTLAQRLRDFVRADDIVFRVGGDEFVLLVEHLKDSEAAARQSVELIAQKLLDLLHKPIDLDHGVEAIVTGSIGASFLWKSNADATMIIREADQAMYQAKREGGNRVIFSGELGLTWHQIAKTGNRRIDKNHECIEKMFQSAMSQDDVHKLVTNVQALMTEIEAHYRFEEQIAREDGLNFNEPHRTEHQRMSKYLQHLGNTLGPGNVRTVLLELLENVRQHLQEYDFRMVEKQGN